MRKNMLIWISRFMSCIFVITAIFSGLAISALAGTAEKMMEISDEANTEGENRDAVREFPKNPVHHCTKKDDGSDNTEWSYVYFGSYPQSEVTGDELTEEITGASYVADGDARVNGTRYRRISWSDTNGDDYSTYRYFKWERIKWRVLNVNDSTMFVLADQGLDCGVYNEEYTDVTWENSALRNWLNNDFYEMAFNSGEQETIIEQLIANEDNPYHSIEGGNDTTDKIFLLSLSESMNPNYGLCENYSTYSASRWIKASNYAYVRGAIATSDDYVGNCWWWLRTPGSSMDSTACVYGSGCIYEYGFEVFYDTGACVPALHINLNSDLWSIAEKETGVKGEENKNDGDGTTNVSQVLPKNTALKGKIRAKSKSFTVKWKKEASVTGYQIQISLSRKFPKKATKTKLVKQSSKTSLTIKKLKPNKKYYVRIRTYIIANGKIYYSNWSKTKWVKTRK